MLSPMNGLSDYPFRSLCRELGSAMSYTEFIKAEDILHRKQKTLQKLAFDPAERPVVIQLYGADTTQLVEAGLRIQELQPDIIDINMGCPTRSISNRGAGAGLLRTPVKIARIIRRLTAALEIPVSAKIRLGWDENDRRYRLIARIIEENGGSLLAVHARTRQQGYTGSADWDAIAEIKQLLSIPVIGNGDVRTPADIDRMKSHTGCDGVMIGRGALANPWIFSHQNRTDVSPEQVRAFVIRHLQRNLAFYGREQGLKLFRKFAAAYLSCYRLSRSERTHLFTLTDADDFMAAFEELYQTTIIPFHRTE